MHYKSNDTELTTISHGMAFKISRAHTAYFAIVHIFKTNTPLIVVDKVDYICPCNFKEDFCKSLDRGWKR